MDSNTANRAEAARASLRERIVDVELWRLGTKRSGRTWRDEVLARNRSAARALEAVSSPADVNTR